MTNSKTNTCTGTRRPLKVNNKNIIWKRSNRHLSNGSQKKIYATTYFVYSKNKKNISFQKEKWIECGEILAPLYKKLSRLK